MLTPVDALSQLLSLLFRNTWDQPASPYRPRPSAATLEEIRTGQGVFLPPGDATKCMGAGDDSLHIIKEVILVGSIQVIKRRTTYGR